LHTPDIGYLVRSLSAA